MKKIEDKFQKIVTNSIDAFDDTRSPDLSDIVEKSTEFTMNLLHSVWEQRKNYDTVEEALLYILRK